MAVTKSLATPSNRIRDNQRRSRARRKEHIDELEERVRKFERLGVQASTELQAVAQKVARENTALRSLLVSHGVTVQEIEARLGATSQDIVSHSSTKSLQSRGPNTSFVNSESSASTSLTTSDPIAQPPQIHTSLPSTSNEISIQQSISKTQPHLANRSETDKQNCAADEDDATSCETAAWIIANLRGHDNAEEVRAELGCTSDTNCNVRNLTVFNAMDR